MSHAPPFARDAPHATRSWLSWSMSSIASATPDAARATPHPLSDDELRKIDAYWRAANYLSVGQIYLMANPLLREPLLLAHVKPRLLGHWGTTPGLNFIYAHLNRLITRRDVNAIYVTGPGHGGPGIVANTDLEGTYSELDPGVPMNTEGIRRLFKQISFPRGSPSHAAPEPPGSINEGDEPDVMHQLMAATLDEVADEIQAIQHDARTRRSTGRPVWPMIVLRTPKGWTGPKEVDGKPVEGTWRAHQVPLAELATRPDHLRLLEEWMRSYRPEELFDAEGKFIPELAALAPRGTRRMGANPHANGGILLKDLALPDFRDYA